MEARDLDGLLGTVGLQHPIALLFENLARDGPEGLLVFDEQDRLPPFRGHRRRRDERRLRRLVDARQIDLERRASPHLAVHPHVAAGLLDRAVHHGQAEAGALPLFLGREEGLEDLRQDLLGDPAAGVADGQHHVPARPPWARCRVAWPASTSALAVSMRSTPPSGMASRAFTQRFITTCSSCPGSAFTWPRSAPGTIARSMSSPMRRPSHLLEVRQERR